MEGGFSTTLVDALTKEVKEACEAIEEDNTSELYLLVESIDKVKLSLGFIACKISFDKIE